jgi:hypothetical protein
MLQLCKIAKSNVGRTLFSAAFHLEVISATTRDRKPRRVSVRHVAYGVRPLKNPAAFVYNCDGHKKLKCIFPYCWQQWLAGRSLIW